MFRPSLLFCFVLSAADVVLHSGYSVDHGNAIRNIKDKSLPGSSTDVHQGYPQVFTHKTSLLLAEALDMLHRAKDIKEKQWLEAFVNRLGRLAAEMERPSSTRLKPNLLAHKSVAVQPPPNSAIWTRHSSHSESSNAEMSLKNLKLTNKTSTFLKPKSEEDELVQQLHSQPVNPRMNSTNIRVPSRNYLLETSVTTAATPTSAALKLTKMVNPNSVSKIHLLEKVGGAKEDVLTILKRGEESFDDPKESSDMTIEEGAAEGELAANNNVENLRTVAPSASDLPDVYQNDPGRITSEDTQEEPMPVLQTEELGSKNEELSYGLDEEGIPAVQTIGFQDGGRYENEIPIAQRGHLESEQDGERQRIDDELVRQLEEEKYITVSTQSSITHNQDEQTNTEPEIMGEISKTKNNPYKGDTGKNALDQMMKRLTGDITRHVMK
ncbi:uncharacterized protein LOC106473018 isoform X2 [Limulus polyphemus]|uniref:Uncharacterized protein LOC106473018 isoform X2 n=1 Tax=Limulus polyphemus TaxID=6850 RepID=A0ABM1TMX8_LIMPO|nr:uncharacterized protein LOC106473018 isoform X2 [Limulus polyphemus]